MSLPMNSAASRHERNVGPSRAAGNALQRARIPMRFRSFRKTLPQEPLAVATTLQPRQVTGASAHRPQISHRFGQQPFRLNHERRAASLYSSTYPDGTRGAKAPRTLRRWSDGVLLSDDFAFTDETAGPVPRRHRGFGRLSVLRCRQVTENPARRRRIVFRTLTATNCEAGLSRTGAIGLSQ
jgi:hypothetical protein